MRLGRGGGVLLVGDASSTLSCFDGKSGELLWNEKKALGKGAIAYADNRFYCQGESDGRIFLIEANTEGWRPRGQFTLNPQSKKRSPKGKVWTHPVISNGMMYLRDQDLRS